MGTIKKFLVFGVFQRFRIYMYRVFSTCRDIKGKPAIHIPSEFAGKGKIIFNGTVNLGVYPSPYFWNGSIYLEARNAGSLIEIGDGVWINNNTVLISEGPGIEIGNKTLIGSSVEIYDSDFHGIAPQDRMNPSAVSKAGVKIGKNVFIGSNSRILKGVSIGDNSVIGNSSIVTTSIPCNSIAAGCPAKVIRSL